MDSGVEHLIQLQEQNKGPIAVFFKQKTKPPWRYAVPSVSDLLKRLEAARQGAATKPAAAAKPAAATKPGAAKPAAAKPAAAKPAAAPKPAASKPVAAPKPAAAFKPPVVVEKQVAGKRAAAAANH